MQSCLSAGCECGCSGGPRRTDKAGLTEDALLAPLQRQLQNHKRRRRSAAVACPRGSPGQGLPSSQVPVLAGVRPAALPLRLLLEVYWTHLVKVMSGEQENKGYRGGGAGGRGVGRVVNREVFALPLNSAMHLTDTLKFWQEMPLFLHLAHLQHPERAQRLWHICQSDDAEDRRC